MKRFRKQNAFKVASLIIILLSLTTSYIFSFAEVIIPEYTTDFLVNDFANVLSNGQEREMFERAKKLAESDYHIEVVVSTIYSLDGVSIEDYANMMYNKYEIGLDSRGVLILFSLTDREIKAEIGDGLGAYLSDAKAGRILDECVDKYFNGDNFDGLLVNLQKVLIDELYSSVPKYNQKDIPITIIQTEENVVESSNEQKGGIKQIVRSFDETLDSLNEEVERRAQGLIPILSGVVFAIAGGIVVFIIFIVLCNIKANKNKTEEENKNARISKLEEDIYNLKNSLGRSENELNNLREKYNRARMLHPRLDSEIDEMIKKEIEEQNRKVATSFDSKYSSLVSSEVVDTNIDYLLEKYHECQLAYESLNSEQKRYVCTDMEAINSHYEEALNVKRRMNALAFNESLKACVTSKSGSESNLKIFNDFQKKYVNMDSVSQSFVDVALINKLKELVNSAETERKIRMKKEEEALEERRRKENEERKRRAEEERRRSSSFSSSSSSSSSSSRSRSTSSGSSSSRSRSTSSSSRSSSSYSHRKSGGHSSGGGPSRKL